MATYCWECRTCGEWYQTRNREVFDCMECGSPVFRDYKAENVGIAVATLRREREHSVQEYAAKFLPSNADFASPSDPEGKKGMAKWREEHTPGEGNKSPHWPGEVEKKVY